MQIIFDTDNDSPRDLRFMADALTELLELQLSPSVGYSAIPDLAIATGPAATLAPPLPPLPGAAAELDSEHLPWDERIHASTKGKTKAGVWTRKKGIEDGVFNTIRVQLRAAYPEPASAAATIVPAATLAPPLPPPAPLAPSLLPAPEAAAAPLAPPIPPAAPIADAAAPTVTWPQICVLMQQKIEAGKTDIPRLNAISAKFGLNPFALGAGRPDLWNQLYSELCTLI